MKAATVFSRLVPILLSISIHAAREGGDLYLRYILNCEVISIHAAREGGDNTVRRLTPAFFAFQSTPPVKAAT